MRPTRIIHAIIPTTGSHPLAAEIGRAGEARFQTAKDTIHFSGESSETTKSPKRFWATVNKAALGGKQASAWRKFWGLFTYPYQVIVKGFAWMLGHRDGFKALHPLHCQNRKELLVGIGGLQQEIRQSARKQHIEKLLPDLFLGGSLEGGIANKIPRSRLIKLHGTFNGLKSLIDTRSQKNWEGTQKALEHYLAADGKNNGVSCAEVSYAHAQRLAKGSPELTAELALKKRKKLPACEVTLGEDLQSIIKNDFATTHPEHFVDSLEKKLLIQKGQSRLIQDFNLAHAPQELQSLSELKERLHKAGSGAQALLFEAKNQGAGETGHATLAVNINGNLFHIDNTNQQSAVVRSLESWAQGAAPDRVWFARLQQNIHEAIAVGSNQNPVKASEAKFPDATFTRFNPIA